MKHSEMNAQNQPRAGSAAATLLQSFFGPLFGKSPKRATPKRAKRYKPNGKREVARRRRQMEARA